MAKATGMKAAGIAVAGISLAALLGGCSSGEGGASAEMASAAPAAASAAPAGASAAPAPAAASAAPSGSREAYFGTRNVRICVSGGPGFEGPVDLSAMQFSKGPDLTLTDTEKGPSCFVSNNDGFNGYAGVNLLFDDKTIVLYGQNLSLQRPDLLLCETTKNIPNWPVTCAGETYDKQTFSEGDTKGMRAKGHEFSAKRNTNTDDYIEFAVTITK